MKGIAVVGIVLMACTPEVPEEIERPFEIQSIEILPVEHNPSS
jgi:hypothetical protein